jgi:hypothetical protein
VNAKCVEGSDNMKEKIWIAGIGMVLLLVLTSFSIPGAQSVEMDAKNQLTNMLNPMNPRGKTSKSNTIEMIIYQFQKNGDIDKTVKKLTSNENLEMMDKLMQTEISNLTPKEIFEEKLEILKEYKLISSNTTLEDIMDVEKLESYNSQSFNISEMEPFVAHFAPIFIGGFGFGAGFGFRGLPIIRRIAGNIFTVGVIGLGAVFCLDLFASTLYYQITFTLPLLVHVLAGFVGIMLFAFDSIFPPIPGKPPVTIYSNIVALGIAGLAAGTLIPPM